MSLKRFVFQSRKWLSIHVAGYVLQSLDALKAFGRKQKPTAKFVLFGKGRSGTTLLVSLMNSHPDLFCDGEILNKKVARPLGRIRTRERLSPNSVYGFKLLSYQLRDLHDLDDPKAFLQSLIDDEYKLIHLRRHNNLRQLLSRLYAEHRMAYHEPKAGLKKITTKKLSGFIAHADEVEQALSGTEYERFLD